MDVRNLSEGELRDMRSTINRELAKRDAQIERSFPGTAACDVGADASPIARALTAEAGQAWGAPKPLEQGLTLENVEDAFRYHPWHPGQVDRGNEVRDALVMAAKAALRNVPPSPDRSAGLRKLREARMDFNSAITHDGRF